MHIFDIIGPVMIGPSSSHTAGAGKCFFRQERGKIEHQDLAFFHGVNVDMTRYLSGTHRLGAEDIAASQMIDDDLVPVFVDQIFFQHAGEQNAGAAGGIPECGDGCILRIIDHARI